MNVQSVRVSAAGVSAWIPVNRAQRAFGIGFGCSISNGAALTYKVQHTISDLQAARTVTISRSTTTATVTDTAHGLVVGDSVVVTGSASSALDGTFAVASIIDADNYTYTCANSGPAAAVAQLTRLHVFDHATVTGKSASSDGNYAYNVTAIRLNVTAYTSGSVLMEVNQGF